MVLAPLSVFFSVCFLMGAEVNMGQIPPAELSLGTTLNSYERAANEAKC